jgi:hypothetical protein
MPARSGGTYSGPAYVAISPQTAKILLAMEFAESYERL